METLAVVCDDNIECHEDQDEAQCRTGTDKYDPIVYTLTALMGLVYVVLKLHWFFYQRLKPVGDEEDDYDDMEMEEMEEQKVYMCTLVLIKFHKQSLSGNGGGSFSHGFY